MSLYIKNKIRSELHATDLPDLEFLFSQEVLEVAEEFLWELLEEEKIHFEKKLWISDDKISFELFEEESILDYFWGYLHHLKWVYSTNKIREVIENFEPKLVEYWNFVAYNKRYFEMLVLCQKNCWLDSEQNKIISDTIKAYKVRWIALNIEKQEELKNISQKLSKLTTDFSNNVLDSENEFSYTIRDFEIIKDVPKEILERVKKEDEYIFSANPSDYINIMKYCNDSQVRKDFWQARVSFASQWKYDNRQNVLNILQSKNQKAQILWYKNYAELSLEFKMADSPKQILDLLKKVSSRARKKAEEERVYLEQYFNLEKLEEWDVAYYYRKLKEEKYKLDDKELKKYFEFETVLEWLHTIVQRLFWLELKELSRQNIFWKNIDIRIYEVYRDWKKIAYYMLDAFYGEEKRSGAWADNLRPKFGEKLPFIINVCNFTKEKGASLLSLGEVQTLFHEFGHATHEMLGKSKYSDLTGFWVEWDFVEVPSQFLEHWADESESLVTFAKHYKTGEIISGDYLEKLEALDKIWNGNGVLKQNEYAFLDMILYSEKISQNVEDLDNMVIKWAQKNSIFPKWEDYKPYASFSHIFAWWYSAGYYSYMWAEILELDILREFKKKWMFNKGLAKKYTQKVLEQGSIKKASEIFYDFMEREVDTKGFFEKKGI